MSKKKSYISFLLGVLFVAMLSTSAAAALTTSDLSFGSATQERGVTLQRDLTVTNTGTNAIGNITLSHNADSDYKVVFVNSTSNTNSTTFTIANLAAGASTTVPVKLFVARKHSAVDTNSVAQAFSVGTISASGTEVGGSAVSDTSTINVQAANKLTIDKAVVSVNGDTTNVNDDSDSVDGILPGDEFCVEVFVESEFNDRDGEDFEIRDVEAFAEVDDPDFDYSESDDIGDLGAEDDDSVQLDCDIVDDEVEDGTADLVIRVFGTDENQARHGQVITAEVEIDKERNDVIIRSASITPNRIEPDTKNIEARVTVFNRGRSDQDNAGVEVISTDLDIQAEKFDLSMDEGDEETVRLNIPLPGDLPEGEYVFTVRAFADGRGSETDSEVLTLVVARRSGSTSTPRPTQPEVTQPETPTNPEPTTPRQPEIIIPPLPENTNSGNEGLFGGNTALWIGLLVAGIGFVLLLIIILIVVLVRSSKN